jgi:hypothetical protein
VLSMNGIVAELVKTVVLHPISIEAWYALLVDTYRSLSVTGYEATTDSVEELLWSWSWPERRRLSLLAKLLS